MTAMPNSRGDGTKMLADLSGGYKAGTEQARRSDLVEWSALCSLCGVPLFTQRLARNLAPSGLTEAPGDDSGRAGPLDAR